LSYIRDAFGDKVAALVDGASEPEELINAEGGKSKTWPERKAHTIDFIQNAGRDMKLLSCADKLANLRDIIRDYDRLGDGMWVSLSDEEAQAIAYHDRCMYLKAGRCRTGKSRYCSSCIGLICGLRKCYYLSRRTKKCGDIT